MANKLNIFVGIASIIATQVVFAGSATWRVNAPTSNWNSPNNWTPATVPNAPTDIANFSNSNTFSAVINSDVEIDGLVFRQSSGSFTITTGDAAGANVVNLTFSGAGVVNDSQATTLQVLAAAPTLAAHGAKNTISFHNSAMGGDDLCALFAQGGQSTDDIGGEIDFYDNTDAGQALIENLQGLNGGGPGSTQFFDNSSAGDNRVDNGASKGGSIPGFTIFHGNSTAGSSVVVNNGSFDGIDAGGSTLFLDASTAGEAVIQTFGAGAAGDYGQGSATFAGTSSAGNAFLLAESSYGGTNGGSFIFLDDSTGGTAQVSIPATGSLTIANHNPPGITIGSLESSGLVTLGSNQLSIGSNNLSTTFFGVIQGGGSIAKLGTGSLTFSGANTYSGGTTITAGALRVSNETGSATGTGPIAVNGGTLGGGGTIAGNVTVGTGSGTGAVLEPAVGASSRKRLTIQGSLDLKADSTLSYKVRTRAKQADEVVAAGVVIESGAQFLLSQVANRKLTVGLSLGC
jgi:autotransporter-associated beta strand protein